MSIRAYTPRDRGAASYGFTLIELLIVMTIMSILAALLLPVLRDAIESAYDVSCRSNLKQICAASYQYADDWDGRIVPVGLPTATEKMFMRDLLRPYLGSEEYGWSSPPVFQCQVQPEGNGFGYGMNACLTESRTGTNPVEYYTMLRLSQVKRFHHTIIMFEVKREGRAYSQMCYVPADWSRMQKRVDHLRHEPAKRAFRWYSDISTETYATHYNLYGTLGKSNYVFLDGHVTSMSLAATLDGEKAPWNTKHLQSTDKLYGGCWNPYH